MNGKTREDKLKLALGNLTDTDNTKYYAQYGGINLLRFRFKIFRGYFKAYFKLFITLLTKKCYYGPFKGEFGHFLGHNLPFLYYLYSKGVKIQYCGMELHAPFLVDENGQSIIAKYYPLRDFFAEVSPISNTTIPPKDVQKEIDAFINIAKRDSFVPFWNINDDFYYWYIHRNWMIQGGFIKVCNLQKVYSNEKKRTAVIFPRRKGSEFNPNNGLSWDYMAIARAISPYFEKIFMTGHPSLSNELQPEGNIEICLSKDNKVLLEKCAMSQLIISQHSGVNYLTEYINSSFLLIYKGDLPIGNFPNTIRIRNSLGCKHPLDFAFSMEEITDYIKSFNFIAS
jgi:hypothetical protein